MDNKEISKNRLASHLLPPPGGDILRRHLDVIEKLHNELRISKKALELAANYIMRNQSPGNLECEKCASSGDRSHDEIACISCITAALEAEAKG